MGSSLKSGGHVSRCGARNRQGQPCGNPGTGKGGRCRFHGGRSTGVSGNLNSVRHGAHSYRLWPAEAELFERFLAKGCDLANEVALLQVMLVRVTEGHHRVQRGELVVEEIVEGPEGTRTTKRRPDYLQHLIRLARAIAYLQQVQMAAGLAAMGDPEYKAAQVRRFLDLTSEPFDGVPEDAQVNAHVKS
jgi:hypothetical protein